MATADSIGLVALGCLALLASATTRAATPIDWAAISPDVTVELDGAGGGAFADEDVALDNLLGVVVPANLGVLPAASEISGYALLANGDHLLSFDTTVELPGPIYAQQGDVVRYDGSNYSIEFDASANGVSVEAECDAVALDSSGYLHLSFDITVELPNDSGGSITAADEDIVRVLGPSSFTLIDASLAGVPGELDVDGLDILADGDVAGSFDTSAALGGISFDDEDVFVLDLGTFTWSRAFNGSAQDADWGPADVDAVALPEPGFLLLLGPGLVGLLVIGRGRFQRYESAGFSSFVSFPWYFKVRAPRVQERNWKSAYRSEHWQHERNR